MSSPLAIAAVTAILKDLLNEGLINNDLSPVGSFTVTALPPDRITIGDTEESRLNLFLYQVTPNPGWRNVGFPSRAPDGVRLSNPPLALDLHYMLTAYGASDLTAEILLGYAMDLLHDTPVLDRDVVRRALSPDNPVPVNLVPPDSQGRTALDLADQIEVLKVTPTFLSADELSKLWTAMQARYRPTVAYKVSTVLIQGTRPTRTSLPVLRRGSQDRGVSLAPNTDQPPLTWPTLLSMTIDPGDGAGPRTNAELGDLLAINGALLGGDTVIAQFRHRLLDDPVELPAVPNENGEQISIQLPQGDDASASDLPAGTYSVSLRIERAGKPTITTNDLALVIVPRLSPAPTLSTAGGTAKLKIIVAPPIWPGQRVDLLVGNTPFRPEVTAKTANLEVPVTLAPSEIPLPIRLRVDGAENQLIRDSTVRPLAFDPAQSVLVPAMNDNAKFEANNQAYLRLGILWLRELLEERRRLRQLPVPVPVPVVAAARHRGFLGIHFGDETTVLPPPLQQSAAPIDVANARAEFDEAAASTPAPALVQLAAKFGLSELERNILLLCVAMEIDTAFPLLISAVQDALPIAAPSFGLALELFPPPSWDALSPTGPLRRFHLIEVHQSGATSLLTAPLRIDERVAAYIKGLNYLDERLAGLVRQVPVPNHLPPSHQALAKKIEVWVKAAPTALQIDLVGWDHSSKSDVAAAGLASAGFMLLEVNASLVAANPDTAERFITLWQREAALLPIALLAAAPTAEQSLNGDDEPQARSKDPDPLRRLSGVILFDVAAPNSSADFVLAVDPPTVSERRALWASAWPAGETPDERKLNRLAGEFAVPASRIQAAINAGASEGQGPDADRYWDWCVARSGSGLEGIAERIQPRATIKDVKLADRDHEQLERLIRHGKNRGYALDKYGFSAMASRGLGLAALFHGESGTGKTFAAEAIANSLDIALYRIDLASVMSKYIGDTTKKLRALFDAADGGGVILLFDEADAVFGKRSEVKDSHDRFANIDINYLLIRMETFSGITILTTNMKHALDSALLRRVRFMIGFGFPGVKEREEIWKSIFPEGTPLAELDYTALAKFPLSGGSIFNVALGATHEAAADGDGKPVSMQHILTIIQSEMQKLERPLGERQFGLLHSVKATAKP